MTLFPVLAETVEDGRLDRYLADDDWCAEQKLDGMRILVHVVDGDIEFLQRNAKPTQKNVTAGIRAAFKLLHAGEWYFDGELVLGDQGTSNAVLWLFDMPMALDKVTPDDELEYRKSMLDAFYERFWGGYAHANNVKLLPTAFGVDDKALLAKRVRENGGEGVMLKHLAKPYEQPRNPNAKAGIRSRWVRKAKNWNSADCIVSAVGLDGKDNMQLAVFDSGKVRIVGECTALAGDGSRVKIGDVVEVKYLYFGEGDRLYQPTKPLIRTDKAPKECTFDQLVRSNKAVLLP